MCDSRTSETAGPSIPGLQDRFAPRTHSLIGEKPSVVPAEPLASYWFGTALCRARACDRVRTMAREGTDAGVPLFVLPDRVPDTVPRGLASAGSSRSHSPSSDTTRSTAWLPNRPG